MTNKKGRVIITSSRNIMALEIARSIGKHGIEIIGSDCISQTMVSYSKYCKHHETYRNYEEDEKGFLEDLKRIIKKYKPDDDRPYILIPIFKETTIISREADYLKDDITLALPGYNAINKLHPKNHFSVTAAEFGANIPFTLLPETIKELEEEKRNLKYPLLLKPYDESGGKGILIVKNWDELLAAFKENVEHYSEPPLIQELADGDDFCLGVLYEHGELKAAMAYKNITRFPSESGSGVMRETVDESVFIEEANKIMEPIRWNGVAQIDFIWNEKQGAKPKMIEVNTRFWAGLFHSVTAGVDFPWLAYRLFAGYDLNGFKVPDRDVKTKLPFVWIAGLIDETVNIEKSLKDFGEIGKIAGEELKSTKNPYKALRKFLDLSKTSVEKPIDGNVFISKLREARNAENEILDQEDPSAVKGIAYSLLYFAKFKKLPPEANF